MSFCANHPANHRVAEAALIWYARHFPIERGKLRLVNVLWRLVASGSTARTARLIHDKIEVPCLLDEMLQRQLYFFGTYYLEKRQLQIWSSCAKQCKIVFDIGANAGIYSFAALASNPAISVHAFEPTPEIAARLRDTRSLNGERLQGLHVHELALADVPGKAELIRFNGGGDNGGMNYVRLSHQRAGDDGVVVNVSSVDEVCERGGIKFIDLMKIDVQGLEGAVLRGAEKMLQRGWIGTVFVELNWEDADDCAAAEVIRILECYGYMFSVPGALGEFRQSGPWLRRQTDVIATRSVGHV